MLAEDDRASERSTSASCVGEAAAGSGRNPAQQQHEQVLPTAQQQEQRQPLRLSMWRQQQQQRGREHEQHFLYAQDEQLDVLESTVGNLKDIGLQIGEEIDGHQQLLGELDEQVERTEGALKRNMLLLQKVVDRQSTTCLCVTAATLFLTLLLLLFLAY